MGSRRAGTASNLLVFAATLVVGGLVLGAAAEFVLGIRYDRWRARQTRSGNWPIVVRSPDPVLIWEYRPDASLPDNPPLSTNRYGFRERDYESTKKPAGVARVAFIGDSVTLGIKVAEDETFTRRFEAEANAAGKTGLDSLDGAAATGPRVQALNFGIGGYNAIQIGELLRTKVLDWEPDEVVYALSLNDFDFDDASGGVILSFIRPKSLLLRRLELLRRSFAGSDYYHYYFRKNRDAVFRELLAMRDLLRARRTRFLVAVLPVFATKPGAAGRFDPYPQEDLHAKIDAFLDGEGIARVDLLDAFRRDGRAPSELAFDWWHPNAAGHEVIARALAGPALREPAIGETHPPGERSLPTNAR